MNITREKILSDNKNIKIFVDGKEMTFNLFKSDVINITNDKDKIDITYELEDSYAKAEIIGNDNLHAGYNEIVVRVTAENGEGQDYILAVKKEEKEKEEEKFDIQEEIINDQTDGENNSGIFISLFSFAILGGSGYLIYKAIKKK